MELRKVSRKKSKLRIGLSAASGYGKTYSSLLLAKGIAGDWDKIAIIDTENGSADLYENLGEYNVMPLEAPYSPERYIEAIQACEEAGMEVVIIDSITHEWDGKGGCLEIWNQLGGQFQHWAKITPRHQKFIDAILRSNCHIITTVRRKQDYQMAQGANGKNYIQKMGTKEITRDGFEYELTLNFEIFNDKHLAKASKDRTGLFDSKPDFLITEETGKELIQWANMGKDPLEEAIADVKSCATASNPLESLTLKWNQYKHFRENERFAKVVQELTLKFKSETANVQQ